jgi:hypothetical protein
MGKFDAIADFIFAVGGIAQFVLVVCAAVYIFWGRKFTLLTPDTDEQPESNPGRKFWLAYGIALICAISVFAVWFRR